MTIKELEAEIARLGPKGLEEFRTWFEQFDAKAWDEQIEEDAASGPTTVPSACKPTIELSCGSG